MSWKKYFTPVKTTGQMSPISGGNGNTGANPSRTNYSSFLPDVYSGHPNRLERYSQYDTMALDPEIDSALDILAEFCTQMNEENSTPFHIFFRDQATPTEIKIIKKYLQQWSKLNKFGTRMFRIVRNTFKYGDSFFIRDPETLALFYIDPNKVDKIIVNESEGKEPEQYVIRDLNVNFQNLTVTQINPSNQNTTPGGTAYITGGAQQRGMVGAYPQSVGSRFGVNQNQVAVEAKHVVHLSMSEGLDNNFPFGNSLLESIFKVYKQKELLEDAIIIYRIQRAPERRIFYIDVGNMPSHLAMSFVERVKQEVNQRRIPSISGGGASVIDASYNPLAVGDDYFFPTTAEGRGSKVDTLPGGCLAMDTSVSLLDGRELTIREIEEEMKQGKTLWTYSCDPVTGKVVPGLITWAGVTQKSAKVMRITLDNGESVVCTPDHPFVTRHNGFSPAQDLKVGDSLMPLYRRKSKLHDLNYYEQFFDNETNKWIYTHRMVADDLRGKIVKEFVYDESLNVGKFHTRHHKNFNRYDNSPENLCFMNSKDHIKYHSDHSTLLWKTLREDHPDRYAKILQEISEKSTSIWQNHTPEEYEQRCIKISQGVTEYVDNLSPEEREIRAQNSRDAFKLGNVEFNRKMNSDPAFYEDVVTKRMKYWTDDNRKQRGQAMSEIQAKQWADPTYAQKARDELAQRQKPVFSENMLRFVIDKVHGKTSHQVNAMDIVEAMNANEDLLKELHDLNAHKSIPNWSGKFTPSILKLSMIKYFGYNNWADFRRKESVHNHRITHIEYLEEPIEVGTLTIDGEELIHGYHTFALSIGICIKNSNLGEISDLLFFTQKLMRALRIPSSYLPTGIDDSQNTFNDGRVGTAYIQELRFNKYCERLQSLIDEKFDNEFKLYLDKKGINIDFNLFDLRFNPPQNFAAYRQAEMDTARVTVYGSVSQIPHLSKRFALKRFLGLTPEEIAENEQLWREENLDDTSGLSAQAELRSAGITTAGLSGDLGAFDQATEASEDTGQMETGAPNMGISSAQPASGATTAPGAQ